MRLGLIALVSLLAAPSWAAPARVLTGDHDGFTRLVVELGQGADWTLGRTQDGYELRLANAPAEFDLSGVFDRIGRNRIAALSSDPATGSLRVTIGCSCHIEPFEFRPGTLVLDVKDGPPPSGSPYESPAAAPPAPTVSAPADAVAVNALASVWVDAVLNGTGPRPAPLQIAADPTQTAETGAEAAPAPGEDVQNEIAEDLALEALPDPSLDPMRADLMREISRGAAAGVVTMELPGQPAPTATVPGEAGSQQTRVGFGDLSALPQIRVEGAGADPADLAAEGADCPADLQLDLGAWGDARPVWEQMSEARNGLSGEFDKPDPQAVAKAIRFHLFIGFGQEALTLIEGFAVGDKDRPLWSSIAHVLDEIPDPAPAFAGMDSCDGAAALWAVLARPTSDTAEANIPAIQRSFSALPPNLRQIVGPGLIERLMALNEPEAVDVISNAIRRLGTVDDRGVTLMEAEVAAGAGDYQEAEALLQPLLDDPGPQTAQALVAKIEAQAARGLPMPADTLTQIEAYTSERIGGPEGPQFQHALTLALALTGDFAAAFAEAAAQAETDPGLIPDLWRLLAALGTDDVILEQAAIPPGRAAPPEAAAVAENFAERFLAVGLPEQAQLWLDGAAGPSPILAANIALANHDGLRALGHLDGIDTEQAQSLRIAALLLTGDDLAAADSFAKAGDGDSESLALARARDWTALEERGQPQWQGLAKTLKSNTETASLGPLAAGAALADQAQGTGDAVRALLAATPPVEKAEQ